MKNLIRILKSIWNHNDPDFIKINKVLVVMLSVMFLEGIWMIIHSSPFYSFWTGIIAVVGVISNLAFSIMLRAGEEYMLENKKKQPSKDFLNETFRTYKISRVIASPVLYPLLGLIEFLRIISSKKTKHEPAS